MSDRPRKDWPPPRTFEPSRLAFRITGCNLKVGDDGGVCCKPVRREMVLNARYDSVELREAVSALGLICDDCLRAVQAYGRSTIEEAPKVNL